MAWFMSPKRAGVAIGDRVAYRPVPGQPEIVGTVTGLTAHGVVTIISAGSERIERHFTGTASVTVLPRRAA